MEYLYVKRLPTGLLYLGKTKNTDPYKYTGSGKLWLRAIRKYGYRAVDIETWVLHKTEDKEELKRLGVYYSKLFNVVESDRWANLKPEEGDGGPTAYGPLNPAKRPEVRKKISESKKGKPRVDLTGLNNPSKRPEVREKLKQSWTEERREVQGLRNVGGNHPLARKVAQYTLTGLFVKEFTSIAEANRAMNSDNIGAAVIGRIKSSMGFRWRYID